VQENEAMNSEVAEQSQHIDHPYANESTTSFTEELRAPAENEPPPETESTPQWWQSLLPRLFSRAGFNPFTAALTGLLLITSLSLATWLIALHFKHKTELARLADQQTQARLVARDEPVTPETLQARLDEAQKQLTDVQAQLNEQNADRVLSNQELLGIQNSTLQKEMDELAKPHLDAPIVELDASKFPAATDTAKEAATTIEVPPTAAAFTVLWHKPADKTYQSYLVEWLDPKRTKPLWSGIKKAAPEPMKIAVTFVRRNYPSGKYRLRLSGVDGKKKDLLDTFNLDVKYIPPPKAAKRNR
jgi:hypothetical protein